jgi:hypothetical protein
LSNVAAAVQVVAIDEDGDSDDGEDFELVALENLVVNSENYELSTCSALWADGSWSVIFLGDALESPHSCHEIAR